MSHTKDGGPSGAPLDAGEEENCEEEDDVSRFRSLDLPTSRRTEATTRAEFSETCLRGQVRAKASRNSAGHHEDDTFDEQ